MTSFLIRQRGRGFWLPWIRQTQENNRTPFHNNTFSFALQYLSNTYIPLLLVTSENLTSAHANFLKLHRVAEQ